MWVMQLKLTSHGLGYYLNALKENPFLNWCPVPLSPQLPDVLYSYFLLNFFPYMFALLAATSCMIHDQFQNEYDQNNKTAVTKKHEYLTIHGNVGS